LKRWDCLYKYFTEIQTDDSQEFIQDMNNYETKVYLCFLSLFLGKINSLNLKFQKNISEVSDINSNIQELYSSILNILLKYEERNMSFEKKLCLIKKNKLKLMHMDLDLTKNYEELVDLFTNYYGHVIPISNISLKMIN